LSIPLFKDHGELPPSNSGNRAGSGDNTLVGGGAPVGSGDLFFFVKYS